MAPLQKGDFCVMAAWRVIKDWVLAIGEVWGHLVSPEHVLYSSGLREKGPSHRTCSTEMVVRRRYLWLTGKGWILNVILNVEDSCPGPRRIWYMPDTRGGCESDLEFQCIHRDSVFWLPSGIRNQDLVFTPRRPRTHSCITDSHLRTRN
jgi:hypothetical protein